MLNPNIGKLIKHAPNRYRLVLDIAHTARDISGKAIRDGEIIVEKPVSLAIDKLAGEIEEEN